MTDELEPEDVAVASDVSEKQINQQIDWMLASRRPERADRDDDGWMAPVFEEAADLIRSHRSYEAEFRASVRRRVKSRNGQAVRAGHAFLREIARGVVPIDWPGEGEDWTDRLRAMYHDLLRRPIRVRGEDVQFRALSPEDAATWIAESHEQGDDDAKRRMAERDGMRRIMERAREQGVFRVEDIRGL